MTHQLRLAALCVLVFATAFSAESDEPAIGSKADLLKIPLKTWIARPYDHKANSPAAKFGSKHLRAALNPLNGLIYFMGGDYGSDVISDAQLWTYDIVADKWARDVEPVFGKQGEVMPGCPDEVCWTWDSKRKQFWVAPGFYFLTEAVVGEGGGKADWNDLSKPLVLDGYALYQIYDLKSGARYAEGKDFTLAKDTPAKDKMTLTNVAIAPGKVKVVYQTPGHALQSLNTMTYDPAKKKWAEVPECPPCSKNGAYDRITDSIWRAGNDNSGPIWTQFECETKKYNVYPTTSAEDGTKLGPVILKWDYLALDAVGRKIYFVDPSFYRLLCFDLEKHTVAIKAKIPEPFPEKIAATRENKSNLKDRMMPVFDPINRVVLFCFVDSLANDPGAKFGSAPQLLIYHTDTDSWETDAMKQPEGLRVRGNTFFFDHLHNCLLSIGGLAPNGDSDQSLSHYFIYRYGDGNGAAGKR